MTEEAPLNTLVKTSEKDRIEQIERALLEVGTEVYRLRQEVHTSNSAYLHMIEVIKGLKVILDDKGLISEEDFENAIDLSQAISFQQSQDGSLLEDRDRIKKLTH